MIPYFSSFVAELTKLALPRYEREIAAGSITRGDITPGVPSLPGPLGIVSRKASRDQLAEVADVAPDQLARSRAMSVKLKGAQSAHPELQGAAGFTVKNSLAPGMGASTQAGRGIFGGVGGVIHAPDEAGQFVRTMDGPLGSARATAATQPGAGVLLKKRIPLDDTLNHAVLQHELGEAAEAKKKTIRPFASHLGPEPILRENLAMRNDPEAISAMKKLRGMHGDDELIQKAIRQAGGTPNSPLPLGGRQHRAVERMIDRDVRQLDLVTRLNALKHDKDFAPVGYVPDKARKSFASIAQKANELGESAAVGGVSQKLRGMFEKGKNLFRAVKPAYTFAAKGMT